MHKVKQMERNVLNKSFQGAINQIENTIFFQFFIRPLWCVCTYTYTYIHLYILQQQKVARRGQGINGNFIKPTPKKKPPASTAPSRGRTFAQQILFSCTSLPHPTTLYETVNDEAAVKKKLALQVNACCSTPVAVQSFRFGFSSLNLLHPERRANSQVIFPEVLKLGVRNGKKKYIRPTLSMCKYRAGTSLRFLSFRYTLPLVLSLSFPPLSLLLLYIPHLQFPSTKSVCCTVHLSRIGGGGRPPATIIRLRPPTTHKRPRCRRQTRCQCGVLLHESHKTFYSGKSFRLADVFEQTITFVT